MGLDRRMLGEFSNPPCPGMVAGAGQQAHVVILLPLELMSDLITRV